MTSILSENLLTQAFGGGWSQYWRRLISFGPSKNIVCFSFSANGFLTLSNFIKKSSIIDLFFALCFSAANRGSSILRISLQQTSLIFAGISPVVFFPPTPSPSNCFSPIQLSLASFNCSSASTSSFVFKKIRQDRLVPFGCAIKSVAFSASAWTWWEG